MIINTNLEPSLEDARYGQHAVAVETGPNDGRGVVLGLVSAEKHLLADIAHAG